MKHLLRTVLFAAVVATAGAQAAQPEAYALDPVHTRVLFAIEHAGFSKALGTVSGSTGSLLFDPDDWRSARLDVRVPLTRLDLGEARWNAAALAANLLDGERHPEAHFVSTMVEPLDEGAIDESALEQDTLDEGMPDVNKPDPIASVCGELTLRGVTRPLCMQVTFNALKRHPLPPFRRTAGFSATATLSRADFGIDAWQSMIGDRVELRIEAEAVRDNDAARAFNEADLEADVAADLAASDAAAVRPQEETTDQPGTDRQAAEAATAEPTTDEVGHARHDSAEPVSIEPAAVGPEPEPVP